MEIRFLFLIEELSMQRSQYRRASLVMHEE